jgi:hypothetical protein
MPWSAWLNRMPDMIPMQIDVMWRIGVELDEVACRDLGAPTRAFNRRAALSTPWFAAKSCCNMGSASGFFANTRFVATSRMSEGARSTRERKRSCSLAMSTRLASMAATTSSSFSCDVTTTQHGAVILRALSKFLPILPNSSTVARRSSICRRPRRASPLHQ